MPGRLSPALDAITDVNLGTLTDNEVLQYNSTTARWENNAIAAAELGDVTITSVADNDLLAYDSGTAEWINQSATEAGVQPLDADLTALAALAATGGMLARTGAGAFAVRTLTGTALQIAVANGDGSGTPTFSIPATFTLGTTPSIAATEGTTIAITLGNDAGDNLTVDSTTLVVKGNTGDVGVGIDPTTRLHVYETLDADMTANFENPNVGVAARSLLRLTNDVSSAGFVYHGSNHATFARHLFIVNNDAAGDIRFYFNGANNLILQQDGDVLVAALTASRLMASGASKELASADLVSWVAGTANEVAVADDGDGSITLSLPTGIDATKLADGTVTSAEFQYLGDVTSLIQAQIDGKQALDADLTALAALDATVGMLARTGAGAFAVRTLTGTALQIAVANGDGSATPTFSIPATFTLGTTPSIAATEGTTLAITLGNDAGDNFTVDSTALVVEGDTGDVGVGIAPTVRFQVYETLNGDVESKVENPNAGNAARTIYRVSNDSSSASFVYHGTAHATLARHLIIANNDAAGDIRFYFNGANNLILQQDGEVLVAALTASRLMASGASKELASADLASWVAGTANEVAVADDGDGSITLSLATGIDATKIGGGGVTSAEFDYLGGVTSDIQTQLNAKQALDADLTALAALAATGGMLARTGAGAFAVRTLTGTANEVAVANGDGVAGAPTLSLATGIDATKIGGGGVTSAEFDYLGGVTSDIQTQLNAKQALDADLTALAALDATVGMLARTGAGAFAVRTLTGTALQIAVANGDGSGTPTFSIPATCTFGTTPSIAITAGTTIAMTLGNDAGDDFTVDSTSLVVEGDTGDVGVGRHPTSRFHVYETLNGDMTANFHNPNVGNAARTHVRLSSDVSSGALTYHGSNHATAPGTLRLINNDASADIRCYFSGADRLWLNSGGTVGIGPSMSAPGAILGIDQAAAGGAMPVLLLDQADVSEEFIRFVGAAAAGVITQSIVDVGDANATVAGYAKVYVEDVGNQITDQAYYIELNTLAAP